MALEDRGSTGYCILDAYGNLLASENKLTIQ